MIAASLSCKVENMTKQWAVAAAVLLLASTIPAGAQAPADPKASPEARALLQTLYSISGRYTLAGQHNYPNHIARWTDRAYDLTGKYPALFGQDFGFEGGADKDSTLARPALVEEAKRQWRNGAVVTLTWHAVPPTQDEPVSFRESVQSHLTDYEWSELLTPGSGLYNRWCAQVDVIAGYLRQLRDARVPVLWRPYHEMNGNWFWWGGRKGKDGSAALYRQLFDRLVNLHKLDNLIWVWSPSPPGAGGTGPGQLADFYPGSEYVDVLGEDIYGEFKTSFYEDLLALAAGKPITLGETGAVPSLAVLKAQPKWLWFMTWSDLVEMVNPVETLQSVYNAPNILTRGDPRLAEPLAAMRKASADAAPVPVTPGATAEAKALLARLQGARGRGVLSGQENDPRAVAHSSERVFDLTTKYPAIYGQDLGIPKEAGLEVGAARQAIVEEAKRQFQKQAVVALTWRAPRPTDGEAGGKLTDFEWNELLTPGSRLNQRWCEQVDAVAGYLKQLQEAGVPVLWRPYPQTNGTRYWWAGRKGIRGSAALYRQLFERLVKHHGLRNLIWVWNAAAPGFRPDSPGLYSDYFPGLLYVDALAVDLEDLGFGFRRDGELAVFGVGKPIGVGLGSAVPAPAMLAGPQSRWSWFLAAASDWSSDLQSEALRKLYADPGVVTRAP
jgi:mannan endo-1,4-beta-mannosidase